MLFANLEFWGVVLLIVGGLGMFAGYAILSRQEVRRVLGIALASLGIVVQLMFANANVTWALVMIAVYMAILYGLIVKGEETGGYPPLTTPSEHERVDGVHLAAVLELSRPRHLFRPFDLELRISGTMSAGVSRTAGLVGPGAPVPMFVGRGRRQQGSALGDGPLSFGAGFWRRSSSGTWKYATSTRSNALAAGS